jgi:hypothetical protein
MCCRFGKYDEIFNSKLRNAIAHHSYTLANDNICIMKNNGKQYIIPQVRLKRRLISLAGVIVIAMTYFDKIIFEKMENDPNWQDPAILEYFKKYYLDYYESWKDSQKI